MTEPLSGSAVQKGRTSVRSFCGLLLPLFLVAGCATGASESDAVQRLIETPPAPHNLPLGLLVLDAVPMAGRQTDGVKYHLRRPGSQLASYSLAIAEFASEQAAGNAFANPSPGKGIIELVAAPIDAREIAVPAWAGPAARCFEAEVPITHPADAALSRECTLVHDHFVISSVSVARGGESLPPLSDSLQVLIAGLEHLQRVFPE